MRRYVKRIYDSCSPGTTTRRETREPRITEINENHYQDYHYQQVLGSMPVYRYSEESLFGDTTSINSSQYVFETICFVTMIWTEESFDSGSGVSLGYFDVFKSYAYVPQGDELPNMELHGEGQSMYDMETTPLMRGDDPNAFYMWRIGQLESRLRELEETRTILPREELQEIRQDVNRHFDDYLFEVE